MKSADPLDAYRAKYGPDITLPSGLRVDRALADLELIPLAERAHQYTYDGRKVAGVFAGPIGCGGGLWEPLERNRAMIVLDPEATADGVTLDMVLAHELAHHMEPKEIRHGPRATREAFARTLESLLLAGSW